MTKTEQIFKNLEDTRKLHSILETVFEAIENINERDTVKKDKFLIITIDLIHYLGDNGFIDFKGDTAYLKDFKIIQDLTNEDFTEELSVMAGYNNSIHYKLIYNWENF